MQGASPLAFPGLNPGGTGSTCPGGEDHLKRRSSSPPVPPLLGCRHCSPVPRPNRHAPAGYWNATSTPLRKRQSPTSGTCLADSISAARVPPRGCKGRSPLHKKTKKFPPSRREGGRGDGGKKQAKGRVGRQPQPPSPPSGTTAAGLSGTAGASPLAPLRVPDWQRQPATEKKTPPPETTGGGVREKTIS